MINVFLEWGFGGASGWLGVFWASSFFSRVSGLSEGFLACGVVLGKWWPLTRKSRLRAIFGFMRASVAGHIGFPGAW